MWTGKGRSGIGDTNIQGTWEDWDGLSPNGRQYKNAITQETRNLSGSDYWNARKADYPKQEPEVWKNGMANIQAFAEPVTKPKAPAKKKVDAFSSIMLADKNYTRLSNLSEALDAQFDNGELSLEDWAAARKNIDKRLAAGWLRVCKERSWCPEGKDIDNHPEHELTFSLEDVEESSFRWEKQRVKRELTGNEVFDSLSETNSFLKLFILYKKCVKFIKVLF